MLYVLMKVALYLWCLSILIIFFTLLNFRDDIANKRKMILAIKLKNKSLGSLRLSFNLLFSQARHDIIVSNFKSDVENMILSQSNICIYEDINNGFQAHIFLVYYMCGCGCVHIHTYSFKLYFMIFHWSNQNRKWAFITKGSTFVYYCLVFASVWTIEISKKFNIKMCTR